MTDEKKMEILNVKKLVWIQQIQVYHLKEFFF